MMSASPSAHHAVADDVLYGDESSKFVQPTVNSTSPYLSHLTTAQTEVGNIVSSSQTYKHFLAQKYAAESTSEVDAESHANAVNPLSHASQTFQQQISNYYPYSPLVSSSSHFDSRSLLGDGILESSVDSLQVESSTTEQNAGTHPSVQAIFNENIIESFIKQEEAAAAAAAAGLLLAPPTTPGVTSSSTLVPASLYDTVNADGTVDSTTTANISTSTNLNHSLSSYAFNSFQPSTSQSQLSGVLTYGGMAPSSFSATLLQLDNSQQLLPSLPSPSIQIDQYFNHSGALDKRDENALLEQHPLLASAIQPFATDGQCLLSDNLGDNFLHDIPAENFADNEILSIGHIAHDTVISDVPVLTRARASLPIDHLYLNETECGFGVFARKHIAPKTQFGPIEGVIASYVDGSQYPLSQLAVSDLAFSSKSRLIIFISETVVLSQVDENNSNWTRFVRPAVTALEQNVELITKENTSANELKFYLFTTRTILPNEELRVWYSAPYCERFNIKTLEEAEAELLVESVELDGTGRSNESHLAAGSLATGGHKLRNKIAKSQLSIQQQQSQDAVLENSNKNQLPSHGIFEDSLSNGIQDLFDASLSVTSEPGSNNLNKAPEGTSGSSSAVAEPTNAPSVSGNTSNDQPSAKEGKTNQFKCNICGRVFPRHYSLRRHLVMHSGEKRYKCPVCGMAFNHVYNRNRHLKKHNKTATEVSSGNIQNNLDTSIPELSNSVNLCIESPGIVAANCTESCSDDGSVLTASSHSIGAAMEMSGLKENDNNNNFIDLNNENQHFEKSMESSKNSPAVTVTSESGSSCADNVSSTILGNEGFEDASQAHSLATINKNGGADKPFRCVQCYKRFSTKERLDKHQMVHDESAKQLSCHICKRKFLTNSALTCHVKSHRFSVDEPRKYDCTLCGELFETIQLRREHVVVHMNAATGLYHCPKCNKTFDDFSPIRKHIKSFHSEEIFPCSQCDKVFPRQDKLRLHMLCHSDRWEFKCNFCSKQFKRKDKLKEHTQRMHAPDRDARIAAKMAARMQRMKAQRTKKIATKPSQPNYHEFMYKCHQCLLGFKRRGMLVNHLAKRHPDVPYNSVPELNMPIVKSSKDYYCQYCDKIYKSSSKRKAHIIKNHPGKSLPLSNRNKGVVPTGIPNPTFSATVGSITINPHFCSWCHKQYASKAKLMQHQRKKHADQLNSSLKSKSGDLNFACTSSSESSISSLKLDSISGSDKSESPDESLSMSMGKSDADSIDPYKRDKMDSFLSSAGPVHSNGHFIDNFGLSAQYAKNGIFLNGGGIQTHESHQYTLDSHDTLEDLLNIAIVADGNNPNLLINNTSSSHTSLSNNIITILTTVPSTCTTFSNELSELPSGISDMITQIDFPSGKMLSSNPNGTLNGVTGNGNIIMPDSMEDGNWNQVCEEMAMV